MQVFPINRSNPGPTVSRANDNREPRNRDLPTSRPKDSRYVEREKEHRSPHSRPPLREERDRRPIMENKPVMPISSRDHRYGGSNGKIIKWNMAIILSVLMVFNF